MLEFEKLRQKLDEMAQAAAGQQKSRREWLDQLRQTLDRYANDWDAVAKALELASVRADEKYFRAARPLRQDQALDKGIPAPDPPSQATIIATDGSQIMPDRHAPFLYYLINVGGVVYHHGDGRSPDPFTVPELHYPTDENEISDFLIGSGKVSIRRDRQEIGVLADWAWAHRDAAPPRLAILDQRLLYWPIGAGDTVANDDVINWLRAMTKVHDSGAFLCGYIDRPMTGAVITLLRTLQGREKYDVGEDFDWSSLGKRSFNGGLSDAALFSRYLKPGQRTPVFVYLSPSNDQFAEFDPTHEVCFFYLNPGSSGRQIARVDIPRWVADEETAVQTVHALVYDQCQLLGSYPYALARADEMAVIGRRDHEELEMMIARIMQKYGIEGRVTAKQSSKNWARGGKTRHRGF